ncbi:MAG: cation transporter [Thermoguttaceae bacterium]|nr:cation transporter [Thermoguttaceae bacterium]
MKLLNKCLRLGDDPRQNAIATTSALGVFVNLFLAGLKVLIGLLTSSIAIVTEGANNASDALTSFLSLVGSKLAEKKPDEKHPFGHGRIEYITSLAIAVVILVVGLEMLVNSIKLILGEDELDVSYLSLAFIGGAAIVKYFLGVYTMKTGEKVDSGSLVAVGIDCRNDAFISALTIFSCLIYILFHITIDAYVGALMALIVVKSGCGVLRRSLDDLIGGPGKKDLAERLYREILSTPEIVNAADMTLHNYGPNSWTGSVNVEMDHAKTVGEVYQVLHQLQLRVLREYRVSLVFGVIATGIDHQENVDLKKVVDKFVDAHEHVKSSHALYFDVDANTIYCDFVVDYLLKDWEALRREFLAYIQPLYPDKEIALTIETEFV